MYGTLPFTKSLTVSVSQAMQTNDRYAVAVVKRGVVVSHLPSKLSRITCYLYDEVT